MSHDFTFNQPTYPELEYERVFTIINDLYGQHPNEAIAQELAGSVSVEHLKQALEQDEESNPHGRSPFGKIIKLALSMDTPYDRPQTFNFLFSGAMDFGSRKAIQNYAKSKGHKVATSVSKNVDFLVTGEKPGGSKLTKAKKLGVNIISEKEFFDMVP